MAGWSNIVNNTAVAHSLGRQKIRAVVIGGSAGSLEPLCQILSMLPRDYPIPLLVAQHLYKWDYGGFVSYIASRVALKVTEASDKEKIEPAHVYFAPADYHLLVEREGTLALSIGPKVNWSRPSLDVLFESAARVWTNEIAGIILSGANNDGAQGMKLIHDFGGLVIAQDPATAESTVMPLSAIELAQIKLVESPANIGNILLQLNNRHPTVHSREI